MFLSNQPPLQEETIETVGATTLSITPFSITTPSIMGLFATLSITINNTAIMLSVAFNLLLC